MAMDVLANVLGVTELGNTVLCQSELQAPWGLDIAANSKTVVHLVRRGLAWLRVEGEREPLRLGAGDVVLVGQGLRHSLTDDPRTRPEPWQRALERMKQRIAAQKRPPAAPPTILLCAAYEFGHDGKHPLLALLPRLIRLHIDDSDHDGQLQALVRLLLHESTRARPGAELVVPRLVDSLFVYIVRAWLEGQPVGAAGWFGALRDPQVGRALQLLHETPARDWTVAALAKQVALSRAAFARRFGDLVGEPPLTYLTRWRMNLAARLLKTTAASVDAVATQVGYESATAFGKAFVRHARLSPGRYRASHRP